MVVWNKSVTKTINNFKDYHLNCSEGAVEETNGWYTVCGRRHTDYSLWVRGTTGTEIYVKSVLLMI